jgi:hypothetical protein
MATQQRSSTRHVTINCWIAMPSQVGFVGATQETLEIPELTASIRVIFETFIMTRLVIFTPIISSF